MTGAVVPSRVPLDHVVIYGGFELDRISEFFERAGFFLTPRGQHNHGTVNRLAMLDDQYIELVGFLAGTPRDVRPDVQALSLGINGIAATDVPGDPRHNAGDVFAPALHLERPVDAGNVAGIARFTITHAKAPVPDARAFLCRHHTPELLWVKSWMQHANGARSIAEVRVPTAYAAGFRSILDAVFDVPATQDGQPYRTRDAVVRIEAAGRPGSLTIVTDDLAAAVAVFRKAGLTHEVAGDEVRLALPDGYRSELVFRQR